MDTAVLSERVDIFKDAAFEHLHPRDPDGRFTRIMSALRHLSEDFGQVIAHEEFGELDHEHFSHGVFSLHADQDATLHAINEDGSISHIADSLSHNDLTDLSYAVHDALETELPEGEGFHSEDVGEIAGIRISRGRMADGTPFVALDGENDAVTLSDEQADELVGQLESLGDKSFRYDPNDLYNREQLPEDEKLLKRKALAGDIHSSSQLFLGLVDTPEGRRVRLGLGGANDDDKIGDFTAGQGSLMATLDAENAEKLQGEIDDVWSLGDKLDDQMFEAGEQALAWDETPDGVRLDELIAKERKAPRPDQPMTNQMYGRNGPELTADERAEYDRLNAKRQSFYEGIPDEGEDYAEPREIPTPWGTVVVRGVATDESFEVRISVTPDGYDTQEWRDQLSEAGDDLPYVAFSSDTADQLDTLEKLLRDAFRDADGNPITKSARAVATGNEGNAARLKRYWTRGKGLAKWVRSAHPWTTLRRHLAKYITDPRKLDRTTSAWFHAATGLWSGERKGKNPLGRG